jgi:hypothetical protein
LSIVAASVAGEPRRVHAFPPACSNTWNILSFNIGKRLIRFTPPDSEQRAVAPDTARAHARARDGAARAT